MTFTPKTGAIVLLLATALAATPAAAQKKYGPGASDTEIKIGNTMPYSGNASAYGAVGRAMSAFFQKVNDDGGLNGRKIKFVSLDDGYSPPKTVELTRQLVERDRVLLMFGSLGTAPQTAVHSYLNKRKVPQLFIATGASAFGDPEHYPWTMGWSATYFNEGQIYAKHIQQSKPDAKIAILMQNDDYGRDYVTGFRKQLGDGAEKMIVGEATFEVTDATVDSQMLQLKSSGADTLLIAATPKFAAQAIKKTGELGWKPQIYLVNSSASVGAVLKPAGLQNAQGAITNSFRIDPTDPQWKSRADFQTWSAWMDKYMPNADKSDLNYIVGYAMSATMLQVLKQCGDDLTRENVMKQAANLHHYENPLLVPGVLINTSPTDFYPIQSVRLARFKGEAWELFGDIISVESN